MPEIEVGTETESTNHWSYQVRVFGQGRTHRYDVTLSFQDYDLWSRGRVAPSRVVEAAFEFLLDHEPATSIMSRFDCSVIRRYFPRVDQELPGRL
ncbi:MAG: hypothetical protein AAGC44_09135 [Planctomycetota bacterium]